MTLRVLGGAMNIGLDLDNTIALYDLLFHRLATELQLIESGVPVDKTAVRDTIRMRPEGNALWTSLQATAYGPRMCEAQIAPGFADFVKRARSHGARLSIISHKSMFSAAEPKYDLRASALLWMEQMRFFDGELGFARGDVFFEDTREAKIQRVISQGCQVLVDDLVEVFEEKSFPKDCRKVWYAPSGWGPGAHPGLELTPVRSWLEASNVVFELKE